MKEDQEMCKTKWNLKKHKEHMNKIKKIISLVGWPGYDLVSEEGAKATWLIVQHCDEDAGFQKRCLGLMAEAVENNQASPEDLAYFKDRVRGMPEKSSYMAPNST